MDKSADIESSCRVKEKEINIEDMEDRAHSSERRDQVLTLRESSMPIKKPHFEEETS